MIVHQVRIGESVTGPGHEGQKSPGKEHLIYVSSSVSDLKYRDLLVNFRHRWELYIHGSLEFSTCDRQDLLLEQWRQAAEKKIVQAGGVMIVVSENTVEDEGVVWEANCAILYRIPMVGVDIRKDTQSKIPEPLVGRLTRYGWEWFAMFINTL